MSRAFFVVPVAVVAVAGPLVGVAAASPSLLSTNPANHGVITTAAAKPSIVSATFNETLNSPTSPVTPSRISVKLNGGNFGCTAGLAPDGKTLTCTPFTGTTFTDGSYVVSLTASPAPSSLDTSPTTTTFDFTIDTTPPSLTSRSPAPDARVKPPTAVSATFSETLDATSTLVVKDSPGNTVAGSSGTTNKTVTWTPGAPLKDGTYTAAWTATDSHGLTSSGSWPFTVDGTAPPAPTITVPDFINAANQHAVPVTGTADHTVGNATAVRVSVTDGTTTRQLTDAAVGNDGGWTVTPAPDLSAFADSAGGQDLSFTAVALDQAGNVSDVTDAVASTKDTAAPAPAPSIAFTPASVNAANTTVAVAGTTEPGAGIAVTATDGTHTTDAAHAVADVDGSYAVSIDTAPLDDGTVTVAVTATDAAGNTSTSTGSLGKDTVAPGTPAITTFDDVNAANVGTPRPVSGTIPAGTAKVTVWVTDADNTPVDEHDVTVGPSDTTFDTTVDASSLADGPLAVHAVARDGSDNPSPEATKVVVKDTAVPDPPAFTPAAYVNADNASGFPLGGTAEPFSSVTVTVTDTGAGSVAKTVSADGAGQWSTTLALQTLADGAVHFGAVATDAAGNVSTAATGDATKDTVGPATPAAPSLAGPTEAGLVTVSGAGADGDTMTVTVTSDGGPGQVVRTTPVAAGAYTEDVDVTDLPDGSLSVVVRAVDAAGNTSPASAAATADKDTTTLAVVTTSPADAARVKSVVSLAATFTEQLDLAASSVTLEDSTGSTLLTSSPTLSSDKKTISVTPADNPLAEGDYDVTFSVRDHSHADPVLSTKVTFTVDRTAPAAPSVSALPTVNGGNVAAVPVSGTAAEPGGTVAVTVTDGTDDVSATASVGGGSTWSTTIDVSALSDGPLTATAEQTDAATNVSATSAPIEATKDTVAPAAPSVGWDALMSSAEPTVAVAGTGEDGATVNVSVDDTDAGTLPVAATTTVAPGGSWTTDVDLSTLSDGTLTATVWQTDAAGNEGAAGTVEGTKDTVAPVARLTSTATAFTLGRASVAWTGTDTGSGVTSYDVRYRSVGVRGGWSSWRRPAAWQGVPTTHVSRVPAPGETDCFSVRARDGVGNVSAWSSRRCVAAAVDDRELTGRGAWSARTGRPYLHHTETATTVRGAVLRIGPVRVDHLALVVTTCPGCGSVAVYVGSTPVKTVHLAAARTHHRVVIAVPAVGARTAVVRLVVTSTGKPVRVDGLGVTRT